MKKIPLKKKQNNSRSQHETIFEKNNIQEKNLKQKKAKENLRKAKY